MRVFLTVTNQKDIGAFACQRLMKEVNAFRARAGEGWEGGPLEDSRHRSLRLRRGNFAQHAARYRVTILGSVILVGGVFYIGFKRWLPLIGMGFSLLLCCLVALAAGLLIFGELNMVTVGFCAILIGLGVDFAILIFGRYQQARDDGCDHAEAISEAVKNLGRAVFFGALTTAVGFLALLLSNSAGFTQLGVLIAIGIFLAGIFMMSVFFLFLPQQSHVPPARLDFHARETLRALGRAAPALHARHFPARVAAPDGDRHFAPSASHFRRQHAIDGTEIERRRLRAPHHHGQNADALGAGDRHRARAERAAVARLLAKDRRALGGRLQEAGKIKSFSTPAALTLWRRDRLEANRAKLRTLDFAAARAGAGKRRRRGGIQRRNFRHRLHSARRTGARRARGGGCSPIGVRSCRASSSWWFLVDRYFAHDPLLTTGFVTTHAPITTQAQKQMLTRGTARAPACR